MLEKFGIFLFFGAIALVADSSYPGTFVVYVIMGLMALAESI